MDQYQKMIEDTTAAINLNPKDAKAYYDRASAYGVIGNSKQSVEDFTVAIFLSPSSGAYIGRGVEYGKIGKTEWAIKDFEAATRIDTTGTAETVLKATLAGNYYW